MLLAIGWLSLASGCRTRTPQEATTDGVLASTVESDPASSRTSRFYATLPYDPTKRLYVRLDWRVIQPSRIPISWTLVSKHVQMLIGKKLEEELKVHDASTPLTRDDLRKTIVGPTREGQTSVKDILSGYGIVIFAEKFMVVEIQEVPSRR